MTTSFEDAGVWALVVDPEGFVPAADPEAMDAAAGRLADFASPAFASHVLAPAAARLGRGLIDPETAPKSLLLNRFTRHVHIRWAREIAAAGIECIYIKGFANAHTLYDDPDARVTGDLDLVVRRRDLDRLVACLTDRGFAFRGEAGKPWGFISDASYVPFVSADEACNFDIHIEPDSYPLHRGLDAAALFAGSRMARAGDLDIRVPCPEQALAISISNAAKDKLGPFAVKKALDAIFLLRRTEGLDWARLDTLLGRARLRRPSRVFLALLIALGLSRDLVPDAMARPPRWPGAAEFALALASWRSLFPNEAGLFATCRREALLCADPPTVIHNNWLRLRGLVRPGRGTPTEGGFPGQ
jgi:hypothetical protein